MKRSTLIKRLQPFRNPAPRAAAPGAVLDPQIEAKARELGKLTQQVEETKTQRKINSDKLATTTAAVAAAVDQGIRHIQRTTREVKTVNKRRDKAAATDAAAKQLTKEAAKKAAAAKVSLKKATKDQAKAEASARSRAQEEAKETAAREKALKATRAYKLLLNHISKAQAAFDARELALKGKETAAKDRDKQFQAARKKLAFYGKRLAFLYEDRGVPLPEAVRKLPDLL